MKRSIIIFLRLQSRKDLPIDSVGKNPPAMQETRVRSLGWEGPLEEEMATHSSILAWLAIAHRVTESDKTEVT